MGGIQTAMRAMGFQNPSERTCCGNCIQAELQRPNGPQGRVVAKCKKGGFLVSTYAICQQHQPERRGGAEGPR